MKTRFVKSGNEFYEIDEECYLKKEKEKEVSRKECKNSVIIEHNEIRKKQYKE